MCDYSDKTNIYSVFEITWKEYTHFSKECQFLFFEESRPFFASRKSTKSPDRLGYRTRGASSVGFIAHNSQGTEAPQNCALGRESQGDLKFSMNVFEQ